MKKSFKVVLAVIASAVAIFLYILYKKETEVVVCDPVHVPTCVEQCKRNISENVTNYTKVLKECIQRYCP